MPECSRNTDCIRKDCCTPNLSCQDTDSIIIWIVAVNSDRINLFIQRSGYMAKPYSIGCNCSMHSGNKKNVIKYLDAALSCGKYDGLVLIGNKQVLDSFKDGFSNALYNRIIAEIDHDMESVSLDSMLEIIRKSS